VATGSRATLSTSLAGMRSTMSPWPSEKTTHSPLWLAQRGCDGLCRTTIEKDLELVHARAVYGDGVVVGVRPRVLWNVLTPAQRGPRIAAPIVR